MANFVWRIICICLGAMSCVALAVKGFHIDVGPVLNYIVGTEEIILEQVFGDISQLVVKKLHAISAYFHWGWHFNLDPQWKHIFVILWLYFKQDVGQLKGLAAANPQHASGLNKAALISRISGIAAALLSGFGAGLVGSTSGQYATNLLFGSLPILGFFFYATIMALANALYMRQGIAATYGSTVPSFWTWFLQRVGMGLARSLVGFAVLAIGLRWPVTENPAIFLLIIVWVLLALEWLRRGWGQAKARAKRSGSTLIAAMLVTGNINLGLDMLATIGTAFISIIIQI